MAAGGAVHRHRLGGPPGRIEHQWINRDKRGAPLMVFLHEGAGLGVDVARFSAAPVRDTGCRGLVYSRPGYGRSTPRAAEKAWNMDFMHRQAREVLPALLDALGIDTATDKPWLLGHSDGGSIALLYAACYPQRIAGTIVLAPHILVEDLSVSSIAKARTAYLETDLRQRLSRHHDAPDSAFWGWNGYLAAPGLQTLVD